MTEGIEYTLPCGTFNAEGKLCKKVYIRPWRAKVKRLLSKLDHKKESGKAIDIVLKETVVAVEGFKTVSSALFEDMLSPDREFCALKARLLSKKPEVHANFNCLYCDFTKPLMPLDISGMQTVTLDDFNANPDLPTITTEDDVRVENKKIRTFEFDVPSGQWNEEGTFKAKFKVPTGKDIKAISTKARRVTADADWLIWSRTCVKWGDHEGPYQSSFWDQMTDAQLGALEDAFESLGELGPETVNHVQCEECGELTPVSIYATDFLLRLPRSLMKKR